MPPESACCARIAGVFLFLGRAGVARVAGVRCGARIARVLRCARVAGIAGVLGGAGITRIARIARILGRTRIAGITGVARIVRRTGIAGVGRLGAAFCASAQQACRGQCHTAHDDGTAARGCKHDGFFGRHGYRLLNFFVASPQQWSLSKPRPADRRTPDGSNLIRSLTGVAGCDTAISLLSGRIRRKSGLNTNS